jgi:hypothetical protein
MTDETTETQAPEPTSYGRFSRRDEQPRRSPRASMVLRVAVGATAVAVVGGIVWSVVAWWRSTEPPPGEQIVEIGQLSVRDCVVFTDDEEIYAIRVVQCEKAHDAQVYAIFNLRGDFLDQEGIDRASESGCTNRRAAAERVAPPSSPYSITWITPSIDNDPALVDSREVQCLLIVEPKPDGPSV